MQHGSAMHPLEKIKLFETNFTNNGNDQPKDESKILLVSNKNPCI